MYPDDRVLVGVINRKRDLYAAQHDHWYRIPQEKMPRGVYVEYLAFYLSGSAIRGQNSGIYYYARKRGIELAYRRDLLPNEPAHKHADRVYYKVQMSELELKNPPVLNPTRRAISFIHTTWDRFIEAQRIRDLYSTSDHYVDRIYYALRDKHTHTLRYWEAERKQTGCAAQLQIPCRDGVLTASTEPSEADILLDEAQPEAVILAEIRARIAAMGGTITSDNPSEN